LTVERLQKVLSRAGVASRRKAEELISAGRVAVDGRIVRELGVKVDPRRQRVDVDGKRVVAESPVYLVVHKPREVMCTLSDPEGRKTVRDLVRGVAERVVPVGRLDYHTSGVLLMTNDGEFAGKLSHPRGQVPKEYVAKVNGVVDEAGLARFEKQLMIGGRPTQPAEVRLLRVEKGKSWLSITLREGRNRQIRRLGEAAGYKVMRLVRMTYAGITAQELRPGGYRALTADELKSLKRAYGVPRSVRAGSATATDKRRSPRRPSKR
jgi:23S rRNA pseudouridine2605 synthase